MKRTVLITILAGMMPLGLLAQDDDLYFTPEKEAPAKSSRSVTNKSSQTYYRGSDRDVDEYNRHGKFWSHYQKIGSDENGNDIIEFKKGNGVYPDSTYIDTTYVGRYYDTITDADDFQYTGRMSRWDGFYDPWFYSAWGSYPYWRAGWGWYDPWYDPWYYGYGWGWYGAWYDPWYYGWGYPYYGYYGYYGWGRPWYGYYGGWYNPWYYGGGYYAYGPSGTRNHSQGVSFGNGGSTTASRFGGRGTYGTFGSRPTTIRSTVASGSNGSFGSRAVSGSTRTFTTNRSGARFGGNGALRDRSTIERVTTPVNTTRSMSNSSYGTMSRSGSSFGGSFGGGMSGGSFGGSRGGGSFGGGGGGGHFGGRR